MTEENNEAAGGESPVGLRAALWNAVAELDACVQKLTDHFPRPRLVKSKRGPVARHVGELDDLLASHLKCVRAVSALNSALVLLEQGQIQDVYALCRIVDEQQEDVFFLAGPLGENDSPSEDQVRFVNEFYQEELHDDLPLMEASRERNRVPRRKIRAALARMTSPNHNPSDMNATTRTVHNTFSGFVHGAYVHIMDQYDGRMYRTAPSRHPRMDECADALTNYVYRGCLAAAAVAIRCGDVEIEKRLRAASEAFAAATGCVLNERELREARARMKRRPT